MIYEVINPSDPVTFETDDLDVARAACLLLGEGAYGLKDENGDTALPIFLFAEGSYEKWSEKSGFDLDKIMKKKRLQVAECLDSACVAKMCERKAILAAVGPHGKEAIRRYSDERRSSLNDICGYAAELADKLRKQSEKKKRK